MSTTTLQTFDLEAPNSSLPWSTNVPHIADFKVLITRLLLVLEVCNVKPTFRKSWAGNLLMSDLTLDPSFKVKRAQPNLNVLITRLLLVLEVCNVKPTFRKSWAGNLLMSDLTLDPSFKVKRGQRNLNVLITRLLLVLEVCNVKPTYRKSWAGSLQMWSDLTLGPPSWSNEYS